MNINTKYNTCQMPDSATGDRERFISFSWCIDVSIFYHQNVFSDPPEELSITGYKAGDVLHEGSLRRLKCTALSGNPLPTLEWLAGNKKVEGAKIEKAESGTFVSSEISIKVDRSDNGKAYHCRAQNKATQEPFTKSIQLSVRNAVNDIEI